MPERRISLARRRVSSASARACEMSTRGWGNIDVQCDIGRRTIHAPTAESQNAQVSEVHAAGSFATTGRQLALSSHVRLR